MGRTPARVKAKAPKRATRAERTELAKVRAELRATQEIVREQARELRERTRSKLDKSRASIEHGGQIIGIEDTPLRPDQVPKGAEILEEDEDGNVIAYTMPDYVGEEFDDMDWDTDWDWDDVYEDVGDEDEDDYPEDAA